MKTLGAPTYLSLRKLITVTYRRRFMTTQATKGNTRYWVKGSLRRVYPGLSLLQDAQKTVWVSSPGLSPRPPKRRYLTRKSFEFVPCPLCYRISKPLVIRARRNLSSRPLAGPPSSTVEEPSGVGRWWGSPKRDTDGPTRLYNRERTLGGLNGNHLFRK